MELIVLGLIVSMSVVMLELATDGAWRTGQWHPRLPVASVPMHRASRFRHRRHSRRPVRIVPPHAPIS